jgi:hypothetical protein
VRLDDERGPHNGRRPRAKYLTNSTPANDLGDAPAFTLTAEQVVALVRDAVSLALNERDARQGGAS